MKKRRKHNNCLNCAQSLHEKHNYCANCGQENTDNNVGVGFLLKEFTSNFFSFDSRFGRTLKPFLFSPGKITNAFIEGKRVLYANPIRWYLVISIFHFFFFIRAVDPGDSDEKGGAIVINSDSVELTRAEFDSLFYLPDSLIEKDNNWPISSHTFTLVNELNKNEELSSDEIMDSLRLDDLPFVRRFVIGKVIRLNRETEASMIDYMLQQLPAIMFFILPIYAFILKIFYWRKGLYIKHLIHSLHIHSFVFFILGVSWILALTFGERYEEAILSIAMIFNFFYILISLKNVYKVKWVSTIFRYFAMGFFYMIVLTLGSTIGILVSFLFF